MQSEMKKWLVMLSTATMLFAIAALSTSADKIYKWRDKEGRLHFSDSEASIPAEYRNGVGEMSALPPVSSPVPAATPLPEEKKSAETAPAAPKAEEGFTIPYEGREGSANRVIIKITFNGRVTAPILVDTGSPGLVLSADLADQLGLFKKEGNTLLVAISGIGGSTPAIRAIVDKVQIGSVTEEFVPAHVVESMSDAYEGLIGMDILARYTITIDPANRRLIAKENPEAKKLPAGRNQNWWQSNFREFQFYFDFWEKQVEMIGSSSSPYRSLSTSERQEIREFVEQQHQESKHLLDRLDRYARWNSVPRHWRR